MNISPSPSSITYPRGFLDFLMLNPARGHRVGEHALQPSAMARMNAAAFSNASSLAGWRSTATTR